MKSMFDNVFIIYDGKNQGQTYYIERLLGKGNIIISFLVKTKDSTYFILNINNVVSGNNVVAGNNGVIECSLGPSS